MPALPQIITRAAFRALNAVVVPAVERGIANPLPAPFPVGAGAVVLETTGRRSGLPRRVPLLSVRLGDKVYVSTVRDDSQWLANLEAEPAAKVRLFGRTVDADADVRRGPLNVAILTV